MSTTTMVLLNRAGAIRAASRVSSIASSRAIPVSLSAVAVPSSARQQRRAVSTSSSVTTHHQSSNLPATAINIADSSNNNKRCYSSTTATTAMNGANVTPAAADRRLAGRRRFYERVGIAPADPPSGEHPTRGKKSSSSSSGKGGGIAQKKDDSYNNSVASPISAGVDGTQSATGVGTTVKDARLWSSLLNPNNQQSTTTDNNSESSSSSWHTVTLDGRPLRTPLGLPLTLPSQLLALAVASEWDAQRRYLQPAQMPLMTLCCTAIDQAASDPGSHRADVMRYLMNDTSCYWACPTEDRVLHRKQSRAWDGLHDNLSQEMLGLPDDLGPAIATGGAEALWLSRSSEGNGSSGLPHPPVLVAKARAWVDGLDAWTLAALYSACAESKSFFIGAALIHDALKARTVAASTGAGDFEEVEAANASSSSNNNNNNNNNRDEAKDGKWAVNASRVEEEFNIECWGLVEGGHDYDRLNCSIQMHAAAFLARTVALSSFCDHHS